MAQTKFSNELLHSYGFRSYWNSDEGYFKFEGLTLLYNPNDDIHGCSGYPDNFKYFEDFVAFYEKIKGKKFKPKEPTPERLYWRHRRD